VEGFLLEAFEHWVPVAEVRAVAEVIAPLHLRLDLVVVEADC